MIIQQYQSFKLFLEILGLFYLIEMLIINHIYFLYVKISMHEGIISLLLVSIFIIAFIIPHLNLIIEMFTAITIDSYQLKTSFFECKRYKNFGLCSIFLI